MNCASPYLLPSVTPFLSWESTLCLIYLWLSPGQQDGARYAKGAQVTLFASVQFQALLPLLEHIGQEHGF